MMTSVKETLLLLSTLNFVGRSAPSRSQFVSAREGA